MIHREFPQPESSRSFLTIQLRQSRHWNNHTANLTRRKLRHDDAHTKNFVASAQPIVPEAIARRLLNESGWRDEAAEFALGQLCERDCCAIFQAGPNDLHPDRQAFGAASDGAQTTKHVPTSRSRTRKSQEFPVFSLMIREFDAESSSLKTVPSAKQSSESRSLCKVSENPSIWRLFSDDREPERVFISDDLQIFAQISPERSSTGNFR